MKLNRSAAFPYPVLREDNDDYVKGSFNFEIEISESLSTGSLRIRYSSVLDQGELTDLLEKNIVRLIIFVTCLETYYNQIFEVGYPTGQVEIENGAISGSVNIRSFIVAGERVNKYTSVDMHSEYSGNCFDIHAGSILAIGDEYNINIGREKLAPIDSIFAMAVDDEIPPDQYNVTLELEKITILAERTTYENMFRIRNTGLGRSILLNSVYHPAIMQVLDSLAADPGQFDEKHWYKIFKAKCNHAGVNLEQPDILADSQRLLKSPLSRVIVALSEEDRK